MRKFILFLLIAALISLNVSAAVTNSRQGSMLPSWMTQAINVIMVEILGYDVPFEFPTMLLNSAKTCGHLVIPRLSDGD